MEERDKIPKTFKIYLIILIILLIIFINPNTRLSILSVFDSFTGVEKELELISEFAIDKDIKGLDIYDEKIIQWKDNSLSFLDFNGFEVLKKDFEFKDPHIFWGEETIYIMDRSSGDIYLLNKEGDTIERKKLKSPFYKLQAKEDKTLLYRKDGDEESVDIIDENGDLLKTHKENIPILTVDVKDKKEDYSISTLDIDKELRSIVTVYSIDEKELFTLDIKDEIIVYSDFIKNDLLIGTEKGLYFIDNGKIKWEKEYNDLKDIKMLDDEIFLLYDNNFEKLNLRGKTKEKVVLSKPLEKILVTNEETFIFGENDIIVPKKNKNLLNFKTKEGILDLKYDDGKLLVKKESKLEIYETKEKGEK